MVIPTRVTNADFAQTGPGTLAGTYLRRFWHPIARSQDIAAGRAAPVRIMSEDLTVYRGESGAVRVVQGHCPHRAAALWVGWVEGDSIRCRYHGWKFGEGGHCVEQPGEDPDFARKVRARSYPAQEYLGLVFVYLGEGEAPPLHRHPDFERPGFVAAGPPELWPCNYFNRIDNACDVGHVSFTHRESLTRAGMQGQLALRQLTSQETEYGIRTDSVLPGERPTYFHFHMPNTNQSRGRGRIEGSMADAKTYTVDRLMWRVPVTDDRCVSFVVDHIPVVGAEAEAVRARRKETETVGLAGLGEFSSDVVLGKKTVEDADRDLSTYKLFQIEDYATQVGQKPISERNDERLGRIDSGVILLRQIWRRELQALADGRPPKEWVTPAGLVDMSARND